MIRIEGILTPAYAPVLRLAATLLSVYLLMAVPCVAEAQGNRYRLTVVNNSSLAVHAIHVSSSDVTSWGPDQTGAGILKPGGSFTLTGVKPGEYDVKFVDQDGDACILRNVPIMKDLSWTITTDWLVKCEGFGPNRSAQSSNYRLTINNNSRYAVRAIHMSPSNDNNWGPDRTGDFILRPGGAFTLRDIAPGTYDIKFVDEDGDACVLKGFNVSSHLSWSITTDWLVRCEGFGPGRSTSQPYRPI